VKDTLKNQKGIEIMAKISKTVVDKALRDEVFNDIFADPTDTGYVRINDRQYGILLTDQNGAQRYVRIGVIVAEEREDMTAEELMQSEIDAYQAKQEAKAEKAKKKEEKIARDKARREQEKKKEEGEEDKDDEHQYLPREVRE
jgi:hypothetical protein